MIITDRFVFIHLPKTGGMFVARMLEKLQQKIEAKKPSIVPMFENLKHPNIKRLHTNVAEDQHGTYFQVPEEHKYKPVLAVCRSPFDRYVSLFLFQDWVRNPEADPRVIREKFPDFPDLEFKDFLRYANTIGIEYRPYWDELKTDVGVLTYQFIQLFFKDPQKTISNLDNDYIDSGRYIDDMPEINFIRMEDLNMELYKALIRFGYPEQDVSFILEEGKLLAPVGKRKAEDKWQDFYDKETLDYVRQKERLLFKIFPNYDVKP